MIKDKILSLKKRIDSICMVIGRDSSQIVPILVTKTISTGTIIDAYDTGIRTFGENKVQELVSKYDVLPNDIEWHFIGHLQTNKVKNIIGKVFLIHSLDSVRLAKEIEKESSKIKKKTRCLVQINTSGEDSKFGIAKSAAGDFLQQLRDYEHIDVQGFMTIGPFVDDAEQIHKSFRTLSDIRSAMQMKFPDMQLKHLSMGMSSDYHIALEEGATYIRIGSLVFGERDYC